MLTKVDIETHGDVAVLRLQDPGKLNALSVEMVADLNHALDRVCDKSRAIVLTGSGRAFCSGASLGGGLGQQHDGAERDFGGPLETLINPLMSRLRDLPIPWISSVRGAAAGGGCALALCADLTIASETAYFLLPYARIGLVPDAGCTHLLVRAVGRTRALELMYLGERLPAASALKWGLVNRVVPDQQLDETALELATRLAAGPTATFALMRNLAWNAIDWDWAKMLDCERESQRKAGRTHDAPEAIAAFLEKRPPRLRGS